MLSWRERRQAVVHAVEPIREGSELTMAYIEIASSTVSQKISHGAVFI